MFAKAYLVGAPTGDFLYELFFFLHILCAIVGFGSTFVYAMAGPRAGKEGGPVGAWVVRFLVDASKVLTTPFIYATGAFGVLMVLTAQDDLIQFSDTWISIAFGLFIIGAVMGYLLHKNGQEMLATVAELEAMGPPPAGGPPAGGPPPQVAKMQELGKKQGMLSGISHLVFVLMLLDMVFKPGFTL